jgi:glycosyltransferase involved in cell wall biosynthesis
MRRSRSSGSPSHSFARGFVRFLHVIASVDSRTGGPIEALRQIGTLHQELGHTVQVASVDPPGSPCKDDLPFPVHQLGPGLLSYQFSPRLTRWLRRHGSEFDCAIVHGLWQYPTHAARMALSGRVPYFVYTHGMLDPWFNQRFPLKHIKKSIYWHLRMRRDLDESAGVIFTCQKEMERSISSFFPFHWKGIVAPLGISDPPGASETQIASVQSRFPELNNRRFLLFFGRIHPKKGCDLLVRAFARIAAAFPELILVMAGPGESGYIRFLKRIVSQESLDRRVVWTGMVSGPLKWGLLRAADAFVLPSHQENFAIATVEAMAVNTPVLISDKVQIWPDVMRTGAGLVETDSFEGTERVLRIWMGLSDEARAKMRTAGGACYRSRFTIAQTGRILLNELTARLRSLKSTTHPVETP